MNTTTLGRYVDSPIYRAKSSTYFAGHSFSEELTAQILKWINQPKDLNSCALTCKGWNSIIPDAIHQRFVMSIGEFSFPISTVFKISDFPWPSKHLVVSPEDPIGTFFYSNHETVAFPTKCQNRWNCIQPVQKDLICFSLGRIENQYSVYGKFKDTYFLSYDGNLITTNNLKDPSKGRSISIKELELFDAASSSLGSQMGTWCLPLSHEQVVFLSYSNEESKELGSFLNIHANLVDLDQNAIIKKALTMEGKEVNFLNDKEIFQFKPVHFGDFFVLNNSIINLKNFEITSHGFEFSGHDMVVCESTLYAAYPFKNGVALSAYFINSYGELQKKWEIKQLQSRQYQKDIFFKEIKVNERFIALSCSSSEWVSAPDEGFQCVLLFDTEGGFAGEIQVAEKVPVAMHLINDILIYNSRRGPVNFWHIPAGRLINYYSPWDQSSVVDIQSTKDELVFFTVNYTGSSGGFKVFPLRELIRGKESLPSFG